MFKIWQKPEVNATVKQLIELVAIIEKMNQELQSRITELEDQEAKRRIAIVDPGAATAPKTAYLLVDANGDASHVCRTLKQAESSVEFFAKRGATKYKIVKVEYAWGADPSKAD